MFYTYVLKNERSGKIYIGQTKDLEARLKRHNGLLKRDKNSFTAKNKGLWNVAYFEEFQTRKEAEIREKQLKSFRGREFIKNKLNNIPS